MKAPHTLVIGYGNRRRGDDAAGLLALACLRGMALDTVRLEEWDGDPMGMMDRWAGRNLVVVIDAVRSGRRPGHVLVLSSAQLEARPCVHSISTHGVGVIEAVRLGQALGRLPSQLWVVGIEAERFETGTAPSAAVRCGARRAARLVASRWGDRRCTS